MRRKYAEYNRPTQIARKAIQLDNAGRWAEALTQYAYAVEAFITLAEKERDPAIRAKVVLRVEGYMKRMSQLKRAQQMKRRPSGRVVPATAVRARPQRHVVRRNEPSQRQMKRHSTGKQRQRVPPPAVPLHKREVIKPAARAVVPPPVPVARKKKKKIKIPPVPVARKKKMKKKKKKPKNRAVVLPKPIAPVSAAPEASKPAAEVGRAMFKVGITSKLQTYFDMKNTGAPDMVIKMRMKAAGLSADDIDTVLNSAAPPKSAGLLGGIQSVKLKKTKKRKEKKKQPARGGMSAMMAEMQSMKLKSAKKRKLKPRKMPKKKTGMSAMMAELKKRGKKSLKKVDVESWERKKRKAKKRAAKKRSKGSLFGELSARLAKRNQSLRGNDPLWSGDETEDEWSSEEDHW
eukprot:g5330.t1